MVPTCVGTKYGNLHFYKLQMEIVSPNFENVIVMSSTNLALSVGAIADFGADGASDT